MLEMANNKQVTEQSVKKAKAVKGRYTVILLAGAVMIIVSAHFARIYRHQMLSLVTSYERNTEAESAAKRNWAQRMELPGVENFHKVSEHLYRGAQPTEEGMKQLKDIGIKTIVNLRSFHSDRAEIGDTELSYEHIYMKTWHAEDKEVVRFLKIVTDPNRIPVFVHCQRGADRTGTMCAIYRVAVQGWSKEEAVEEMTKGGFGFYTGWQNLIDYIRELDIEEIKRRTDLRN